MLDAGFWILGFSMLDTGCSMLDIKKGRCSWVQRFRGSRLHSRPRTAFVMHVYEKSVSLVRANPKFGAKFFI